MPILKIIKYNLLINTCVFIAIYFIKSFIVWQLTHPLQFFIDMPKYGLETRFLIVALGSIYVYCSITAAKYLIREKQEKTNVNQQLRRYKIELSPYTYDIKEGGPIYVYVHAKNLNIWGSSVNADDTPIMFNRGIVGSAIVDIENLEM